MTTEGQDPGFESWLEQQLQGGAGQQVGPHPQPAQAAYHHAFLSGGISMTGTSGALAALGGKAAAVATAAVLAAGVGGATAATQLTGSTNPDVWGKTVTAAVQNCKDDLKTDQHGIGQCVSTVAKQKGVEERKQHSQAPTTEPSSEPTSHPTGKPTDLPGGRPSSVPTGEPSGLPGGRPSSLPSAASSHR
jgi:hypothetical protein